MSTEQSYVGKGDSAIPNPPAAQNGPQIPPPPDNRQPIVESSSYSESEIKLPLSVSEHKGNLSEAELVYWALEGSKQSYLKDLLEEAKTPESQEYEAADYCLTKLQEIQNDLFGLVTGLASRLSLSANGMSHE
ncbi:hypothetical protein [Spirosoma spitsbergense]|uniref:hypothetical protein n=1 Tax=Spirosoma spitsbergense TaxID=431554 RepID=UPI000367EF32|nr:hypothetical protein [Spirosoma spitsbergense]